MLFKFSNHQKTVTTLCFDGDETRLLSGSLDRYGVPYKNNCHKKFSVNLRLFAIRITAKSILDNF